MGNGKDFRQLILRDLNQIQTFKDCVTVWRPLLADLTNDFRDPTLALDLGSRLREVFLATGGQGRSGTETQSAVAKAGVAWECLVVWYLNFVFEGGRGVAVRKKAGLVPKAVLEAISVTYGNFQTNSESDVIVICAPKDLDGESWTSGNKIDEKFFSKNIHKFSVGVVQCKTNWNENAQIPMLWDMVYRLAGNSGDLSVGKNGFSTSDFKAFTYSFMTAPTQKESRIPGAQGMPVKRVRNLSGGNYWGLPSKDDVALSFKEIFKRNFSKAFDSDIASAIGKSLNAGNCFKLV